MKYKDRILPPGEEAQSVPTKQVTTHERNPVQFYNDGKAGVRGPEKAAGAAPAKAVTGVTLTGGQFVGKDNVKSKQATKFIGRGSANSSTASYARQWGDRANTGQYTAEDRVFISAEGKRTGRVDPDAAEIGKAMAAGATILTDSMTTGRERDHNVGERQVAEILSKGGYAESAPGVWGPSKNSAAKPSINEKLVDKVVLSENYPTTVAGAEKFLNAAKKRLAALEAEDRRVLNDDDHPTQRLPKEEQEVLDALRQTFDKNSDLAPFFTELDGWDAVPEAEQTRLMKFAESLTGGKPNPKPVAAKSAASFGDKASTGRMQAEFPALVLREPTLRERAEITKHRDALAARLGEKMPKVEGFSIRDGAMGNFAGKAVTRGGQHHILLAKELFDDTTPFLGSTQDKVERATLHEIGHLFDRDDGHFSDNAAAFKEGGRVYEELQALTEASAYAHDWYGYAFGTKNPHRELFAQAFSAFHYNPEALKNAAPKTYSFIRNYLQNRDAGGSGQVGRADNAAQLDRPVSAVQEADTQARKQAFLARAASGDKAQLEHLKTSTDAKGLQRALELLNDHEFESGVDGDNVMDTYDAIEARLAELVQNPDTAYGLQTQKHSLESAEATNSNKSAGPRRRLSVEQHIEKVLGKSVRVAWQAFTHAGQYTHAFGKGLIELSVHALNPMSTAYHESLHAFFAQLRDAGATDITNVLNKAASSEHVIAQLRERFKNQPAVLTQLKDPEERAAYMYQMWASDPTFKVSIAAKNVFQKIAAVIRKALGIWSNDERALHIMEYFHSGEYAKAMGTPNAVRRALMETGTNRAVETAKTFTEPLGRLADAMVSSGDARLRDTNIPALIELADKIKRPGTEIGGDQGFIPAARIATTKRLGEMAAQLEGYTPEQLKEALEALQSGLVAPSPEGRLAVRAVKDILARTKAYMEGAGVELGDLGPDYFPRVWDPHFISQNEQAMQDMLQPYVRSGEFKGNPTEFIRRLTSRGGSEFGIESRKPGMQHTKARDLAFLKNEDVAPFLNKDLMGTLASYIGQAARRAEWERRLGGGKLETLLLGARGEGATSAQMAMVEDYLEGVDGTLGDDINPTARRLMGNMIVYQNIRLLPMAMFSMLVDPMGILVRGGTVAEAWGTFKRGMASIPVTYGKKAAPDFAEQVAELVGVVDNAILTSVMGDLYTQGMVGGTVKKINNAFFKYNMVEGLNRAFRVGASEAAIKFMARHADGTQSTHSARWMAELGLRPGDIKVLAGGHIALTQAAGLTRAQEQRVHAAINQWVDGAMLRPDAADKPIWMNDPHYALISHLKQFVFTFQKVILGRMVHELRNGNYVPAMALATYVPVMIAADAAKGLIQGGGDVPEWKKGWGVADYVGHGVQRAGLFGVGQFGVDVAEDVKRGGSGFGALSGPTLEQLADAVQLMNGHKQFGSTLLDAMPANALYKESLGGHGEAKADPAVPH
jgi:hypothetical protein